MPMTTQTNPSGEPRTTESILAEREKTHGDYKCTANAAQEIKQAIVRWDIKGVSHVHRESLDMIASKIGRILSGNANEPDHWDDIAGYAKLASKACNP